MTTASNPSTPTVAPIETPTVDPLHDNVEPGDHERFAHYVQKSKLTGAMVNGTPVRALCGKVWVPSRDPGRFPVCPECKEIKAKLTR
ncbi:MAG: DUF3039 domain-containing protein [Acidimicrobiales bacterium]|nr:DUF3039 domain-containing protein [Acidimicrobiales bacterium]